MKDQREKPNPLRLLHFSA